MLNWVTIAVAAAALWGLVRFLQRLRERNADIVVKGLLARRAPAFDGTRHVFFCMADHFEPLWKRPGVDTALERVKAWHAAYPRVVDRFRDNGGMRPQHTFFYPQEEYIPECIDLLADLKRQGCGDVEVHLHHDNDTSEGFREKIVGFRDTLHEKHGLLHRSSANDAIEYAFIHGNWALDNSRKDGRLCGVNDEITILRDTGCYADFTFPSAPSTTQPPITNRIYYATDDPLRPCSHHTGEDAEYGTAPKGDLLLITGPLTLNWHRRKRLVLPMLENAEITKRKTVTPDRVALWVNLAVGVAGWPRWVFVKAYTHGAQEKNASVFLSEGIHALHECLLSEYNDGDRYVLHYVTAREMYLCVKALEAADDDWIDRIERFDYQFTG